MYIHDFFQNFLKTFLVCFHGAFTSWLIAQDIPPSLSRVWVRWEWTGGCCTPHPGEAESGEREKGGEGEDDDEVVLDQMARRPGGRLDGALL